MQESQIIKILNENDLSDVEVLKSDDEFALINFYFDFDKDLIYIRRRDRRLREFLDP